MPRLATWAAFAFPEGAGEQVNGLGRPRHKYPASGSAPQSNSSRAVARTRSAGTAGSSREYARYTSGSQRYGPPSRRASPGSAARNARTDATSVAAAAAQISRVGKPARSGCSTVLFFAARPG